MMYSYFQFTFCPVISPTLFWSVPMTHYGPALTSPRSPPTMYRESGTSISGRNFKLTESPVMPQKMSLIRLSQALARIFI